MRGRPMTPLALATANGAALKNPKRYANVNDPDEDENPKLGGPPEYFDALHCAIWEELLRGIWWMRESSRISFEMIVRYVYVMRYDPHRWSTEQANTLLRLLNANGATESYRTKLGFEVDQRTGKTKGLRKRTAEM